MLSLDFISLSHRFLEFIMMFHEFWLSVPSLYHQISSIFLTKVFIVPFIFISFLPPTGDFYHQSLEFICFPQLLVHFIIGVHHFAHPFLDFIMRFQSVFPTYLFIFSLGFISFPHLLAHLITGFHWCSPFLPFIRGSHHVPVLLQCVYYALSLPNLRMLLNDIERKI